MLWLMPLVFLTATIVYFPGEIPSALATMVPIVDLSDNGFKVRPYCMSRMRNIDTAFSDNPCLCDYADSMLHQSGSCMGPSESLYVLQACCEQAALIVTASAPAMHSHCIMIRLLKQSHLY